MSELIGDAELQVGTDLAPLDAGIADAKAKAVKAVAELQAIFDRLHIGVNQRAGLLSDALDQKLSQPFSSLGDGAEAMALQWNAALDSVRASITHTAELTVAASEVEVAAIDKVTAAYVEQAAAARVAAAAGDAAVGRALSADVFAAAARRGGGTGAAFAAQEQRGRSGGLTPAELAALAGAGLEGVRGKGHVGSRVDPMVVVLEAGRYTPLGGMSAAVGYQGIAGGPATTTVAQGGGQQGGGTTMVSSSSSPGEAPRVVPLVGGSERSQAIRDAALSAGVAKLAEAMERPLTSPGRPETGPEALAAVLAGRKSAEAPRGGVILPMGVQAKGSGSDKAVPVIVTESEPKATQAEAAATAAALADLAGREIAPGQRAKAGAGYRAAYEALGYTVASRVPGGPARLYAAGGQPGTANYGLTAEAVALAAAHGGGGGGGGGFPPWLAPLLWGSHGGGGPRLPGWWGTLAGVGGVGAGFGSLGSFAGFGAEHILLTAGGIAGSGVAALGGGALLGAGALGKAGVGTGSDAAVMSSTIADTKQLYGAYEKLNRAQQVYGKDSEQAKEATTELNKILDELSNTAGVKAEAGVAKAAMALNEFWDKETSSARVQASKILMQVLELGRAYIPLVAKAAEENFSATNTGLKPLFEWLKGPEGMGIFLELENEFRQEIPDAMKALDMGFEFFAKTIAAVAPYTGALVRDLDAFFTKMDQPAEFAKWESEMTRLIGDFHVWDNFLKILGLDLVDLFDKDSHTGEGIIEALTVMLDKVHEWEKTTEGGNEAHNLFTIHKEEVIALLNALSLLVAPFREVYMTLAPPLVKSVTAIAEAVAFLLTKVEQLGSGAKWIVGLTLVAAKLKVLGPLLKAVAVETNLLSAAEDKNAIAVTADAEGNLRLAASEGAVGAGGALSGAANETSLLGKAGITGGGLSGDLKGTLLKGGLEAGGGALVANIAATALGIHGTSSAALTAAGAGAGLGFAFGGPFGAAVGAGLGGGLVEAINLFTSHAPDYGKKFSEKFAAPLQADLAHSGTGNEGPKLMAELAGARNATEKSRKLLREYQQEHAEAERAYKPSASEAPHYHAEVSVGYNKLFNKNFTNEAHEGTVAAELLKKTLAGVAHPTTVAFTGDIIAQLKELSGQARDTAAELMLAYAKELEAKTTLPKGAVARMLEGLKAGVPALEQYFKQHALATSADIAIAFNLSQARSNLFASMEKIRTEWATFGVDPTVTGKDWVANVATEMKELRQIAGHETGSARQEVVLKMHELGGSVDSLLNGMVGSVRAHFKEWSPAMKAGLGPALSQSETELSGFVGSVNTLMQSGVLSAQTGAKLITEATNAYLEALGAKPIPIVGVAVSDFLKQFPEISKIPHNGKLVPLEGHAHGGLIQIGRPGEAGHDTVRLNVGGLPIAVAPGEQVAVFNRHQLPIVNAALAPLGGLPGLFDHVSTPNYMASGGIVAPHVSGSGAIAGIVRAALGDVAHAADHKLSSVHPAKGGAPGPAAGGPPASSNEALGRQMMLAAGFPASEWGYLQKLWTKESGWRTTAQNPSSPAYGIPQSDPGDKMASTGVDWRTNPRTQIAWGLGYIRSTYGSIANAWAHELADNSYALGGLLGFARGGLVGSNGGGLLSSHLANGLGFSHGGLAPKAKRKKAAKLPPGVHFNPFGPIPPVKSSWAGEDAWRKLTAIMAPGGGLAAWSELYGLDEAKDELALSKAPHGGAFVVQPNALEKAAGITIPYEDPGNVQMRTVQINLLGQREYGVLNYLTEAWNLSHHVLSAAHAGIRERNKAIADLKARIEDNLKKIKELRDTIKHQEDTLKKLPTGKHATPASRAQAAKLHKEIAAEHGQIKALEDQNAKLGGSSSEVGTGGNIGALVGERTELTNTRTSTEGFVQEIGGASGRGGKREEAQATVAKLAQQLVELSETPMHVTEAKLEAAAGAGETSGGESAAELSARKEAQHEEQIKLLAQELLASNEALSVLRGPGDIGTGAATAFAAAAAGGGLFTGFGGVPLLPYAGAFGAGGIVPGPVGMPAMAVVHGGEEVRTREQQGPAFHQHIEVNTLHPGDPTTLTAIGKAATRGMGYQDFRRASRVRPGI